MKPWEPWLPKSLSPTPEPTLATHPVLRSPAWLLSGFTRSVGGELALARGRLVFETGDGRRIFDAELGELSAVTFPWYYFGGGMKLRVGASSYRVSFARPGNLPDLPGEPGDIRSGRSAGAAWKAALAASAAGR